MVKTKIICVIFLGCIVFQYANAQAVNPSLNLTNLQNAVNQLEVPIGNFIESAKQIRIDALHVTPAVFNQTSPNALGNWLDGWFSKITGGVRLSDILRRSALFVAWLLMLIADLIRRGVSVL